VIKNNNDNSNNNTQPLTDPYRTNSSTGNGG